MNSPTLTWEAICADRSLRDLPYKIETNRYNKIIMSPATSWHSAQGGEIGRILSSLMPHGRMLVECPVHTSDGVRVPDVAWISKERFKPRRTGAMAVAPEICVEVLSPSNGREEMLEKMSLFYAVGASEVWLCDEDGNMEFFTSGSARQPVPQSIMCPNFPKKIVID